MPQFAVLVTAREILGITPKLADLHRILAKYQRREVLFLLAKLNCLLGTWQNTPQFDIDRRITQILIPGYFSQIEGLRRGQAQRIVFSRITILYLVKQACQVCPEDGLPPYGVPAFVDIGMSCLLVNDLLLPFLPSPAQGTLERLANLLPFSDYISRDHYSMEIGRSYCMFDEISQAPALASRSDFLDVRGLFQGVLGLSHLTFSELVFGCATKFLNVKTEDLASPEALILRKTFFQKSAVSVDQVERFFTKLAVPEGALVQRLVQVSSNRPADDFTVLQGSPFVEIAPNAFTCLDPGFLVEKAGRALYWTMFMELPQQQRLKLASFWGAIFELYVNSIIRESYSAGGQFIPEPRFPNGEVAFDACLIEGGRLIVFEHKSSTLRADCKYGGDVEKLRQELHLKFVEGDDEGAKGIAQLVRGLIRFLRGEPIHGVSSSGIRQVYPVMVCLDSSVEVPLMGRYFSDQFRAGFPRRKFRQTITPLFTLSIADVENLLAYLDRFRLSDIFDSFYGANRSMLASMSSSVVPLLKEVKPGRNPVTERFESFAKRMEMDLFPNEVGAT